MKWIVIHPDDRVEEIVLHDDANDHYRLTKLQQAVRGYVEAVSMQLFGLTAFVNEDGIAEQLEFNPMATSICRAFGHPHIEIFGPMVLTRRTEEGEILGLGEALPKLLVDIGRKKI